MSPADWNSIRSIYEEGIRTRNATFETNAPEWERWDRSHLPGCRLVACAEPSAGRQGASGAAACLNDRLTHSSCVTGEDTVIGFAALSPVSARACYAGVAEVSIYVAARARGSGIGKSLMGALVQASEAAGMWTLQASIFPENQSSIRLHERAGFRIVGRRERIAQLDGVWRDVILMERRVG